MRPCAATSSRSPARRYRETIRGAGRDPSRRSACKRQNTSARWDRLFHSSGESCRPTPCRESSVRRCAWYARSQKIPLSEEPRPWPPRLFLRLLLQGTSLLFPALAPPTAPPARTTGELSPLRETDHFALCRSFWVFPFARIR